jgi:tight adherence protein C
MSANATLAVAAFAGISSLMLLLFLVLSGRKSAVDVRLEDLSGQSQAPDLSSVRELARSALPRMAGPLLPQSQEERTRLQARLVQAGFYSRQALYFFLGVKMLLIVCPVFIGLAIGTVGLVPFAYGVFLGCCGGVTGLIGPGFWLDRRTRSRQTSFRRALPDALDVLVICLEGGLSLPAALRRVSDELRTAHPLLANELSIVQREIHLGRSTGEALRQFGTRAGLEEIRTLSSVIIQTERFGSGLVKSLRVHAESLREKRLQYAEEMAQKAATKVLFPTVLFIMPSLFVVILGPGVIQILDVFSKMTQP